MKQINQKLDLFLQPEKDDFPKISELDKFRYQLEKEHDRAVQGPYTKIRLRTQKYQTAFIGMGFLFALLALIVHVKTSTTSISLLFPGMASAKGMMCAFCGACATGSWAIGLHLKAFKEAIHVAYKKAHERIARVFRTKRMQYGFQHFLNLGPLNKQEAIFQQVYREARDRIHERCEETLQLLKEIDKSEKIESDEIDKLSNEALNELNTQLDSIITQFAHSQQP